MTKALRLLLLTVFAASAASAQDRQSPPATGFADALKNAEGQEPKCSNDDPKAVVVCGRSQKPYRIDPNVLAATRAAEAAPPKPALDTTTAERCTGPNCGGGSYVPLVGMALTALKAVELASTATIGATPSERVPINIALMRTQRRRKRRRAASASASTSAAANERIGAEIRQCRSIPAIRRVIHKNLCLVTPW